MAQPGQVVFRGETKSGRPLVIRHLNGHDAPAMKDFVNALSLEHTYVRWQGEIISLLEEEAFVLAELRRFDDRQTVRLLAFVDRELVGIANVTLRDRVERHIGELGISIARDFRGDGIGSRLLAHTLDEAHARLDGLVTVMLSVFGNNATAIRLYERFGFVEFGRLPGGIRHRGVFVDHVHMWRPDNRPSGA